MERRLILASTSRYRRQLLDDLGLGYEAVAHRCDESAWKGRGLAPEVLAATLARAKAESLAAEYPDAWILGSDQVAEIDGALLSKPGTEARARAQLAQMQGRAHRLLTAAALRCPDGRVLEVISIHRLHMRPLDEGAIARYVARDQPLDCGGSYRIEGQGIALFSQIEGQDHTAIIGLPLLSVCGMLRAEGWQLP